MGLTEKDKLTLGHTYERNMAIYRDIQKQAQRYCCINQGPAYERTLKRLMDQAGLIAVPTPPSWHPDFKGQEKTGKTNEEKTPDGLKRITFPDGSTIARF